MAQHVRDLMAEPVIVPAATTLTEAARLMRDAAVSPADPNS
jgi:CBS domain-containing protein